MERAINGSSDDDDVDLGALVGEDSDVFEEEEDASDDNVQQPGWRLEELRMPAPKKFADDEVDSNEDEGFCSVGSSPEILPYPEQELGLIKRFVGAREE